jgi:predicted esterase
MSATSSAAALIVPAVKKHSATVIFAHGLGDSGAGWIGVAQNWRRRGKFDHVKFIFPNAPQIPITVNMGMRMPGWYDIVDFDDLQQKSQDEVGILRSRDYFVEMVRKEVAETGVPSTRMVLGGFSQGGAISLFTGVTMREKLAGVVGLSAYLLMPHKAKEMIPSQGGHPSNKDVPFFMGHGDADPLVRYDWGQLTAKTIEEWGWKVDFRTYKGLEHSADPQEIVDLEDFIDKVIPAKDEILAKQ